MYEIIFIIILIIIIIIEAIVIRRKMAQNDKYEEILRTYEKWIEQFALTVESIDEELNRLDADGVFRSDDEVGFFFQAIYSILKRLFDYGLVDEPEQFPGVQKNEQGENVFYARDRERNRRIQRVRRPDVTLEDIQGKNRKTDKQTGGEHNKSV